MTGCTVTIVTIHTVPNLIPYLLELRYVTRNELCSVNCVYSAFQNTFQRINKKYYCFAVLNSDGLILTFMKLLILLVLCCSSYCISVM